MSNKAFTAIVFLVAFTAGISIGATRPDDDYEKACLGFLAEEKLSSTFAANQDPKYAHVFGESVERMKHWMQEMEKFKP